jgi:hypothetical protein
VTVTPPFLVADAPTRLSLAVPNERKRPMTSFAVTLPVDFILVSAEPMENWRPTTHGQTISWRGGALAPSDETAFAVTVQATGGPGIVRLKAEQGYAAGIVRWTPEVTVIPGATATGGSNGWALLMVFLSIVALSAAIAVARARKARSLEE